MCRLVVFSLYVNFLLIGMFPWSFMAIFVCCFSLCMSPLSVWAVYVVVLSALVELFGFFRVSCIGRSHFSCFRFR